MVVGSYSRCYNGVFVLCEYVDNTIVSIVLFVVNMEIALVIGLAAGWFSTTSFKSQLVRGLDVLVWGSLVIWAVY